MTRITGALHEDQYKFVTISLSVLHRMKNVWDNGYRENRNTHFMSCNFFSAENLAPYEIMWKNIVEPDRSQMLIACWITKATDSHSEYVILTAFSLHERVSL
jgi:hypothetical protein